MVRIADMDRNAAQQAAQAFQANYYAQKQRADDADAEIERLRAILAFVEDNCVDVRCVDDPPDGYHWEVIEHHMAKLHERMISYGATVFEAIQAARAAEREG